VLEKINKREVIIMMVGAINTSTKKVENINSTTNALHVISPESIGQLNGTVIITAPDVDYLVTTTSMIVGAYTVAAQPLGSHVVTVTHTKVGTLDTLGTIVVVGTSSDGETITETITPTDSATVTGSLGFEAITSITGVGWVIDGSNNDTLTVGIGAVVAPTGKYIFAVQIDAEAVVASETFVSGSAGPKLASITALPAGATKYGRWSSITPTSGEMTAYFASL